MGTKQLKAQDSIEIMMIIGVALVITIIVIGSVLHLSSTGAKQIKTFNLDFISSFSYLSENSIYITISQNYNFTNFTIVVYPNNKKYNYTVNSKGYNNYGDIAIVANSVLNYPSYTLNQICSLQYPVGKSTYAYTKNCS
jgi:hypothetical protein